MNRSQYLEPGTSAGHDVQAVLEELDGGVGPDGDGNFPFLRSLLEKGHFSRSRTFCTKDILVGAGDFAQTTCYLTTIDPLHLYEWQLVEQHF